MTAIWKEMKSKLDWIQHLDVTVDITKLSVPGEDQTETLHGAKSKNGDIQDDFKREMTL